jgi:hypothetical protein
VVDSLASHANPTRSVPPGASGRGSAKRATLLSGAPGYVGATGTPSNVGVLVKRSYA